MALTGIETVVDELIAYLKTNLPARVTALAAETPALTLLQVNNGNYHFGDKPDVAGFPALAFLPQRTPVSDDRTDRMSLRHTVGIQVFAQESELPTLTRMLLRYVRAVTEVLVSGRIAKAFSFTLDFSGETWEYSPARVADNAMFLRDALLPVVCWKEEVR